MNKKLKAAIIMKYGSQVDFALAQCIDETLVSKIIRGRRKLDDCQQAKWAEVLGCKVEEVFPAAMHQDVGKLYQASLE